MPRMLIFCGSRDALEKYDILRYTDDIKNVYVITCNYPPRHREEILNKFRKDPDGILAVDTCMTHGWHAPQGTFVVFDQSWKYEPNAPITRQARARSQGL